MQLEGIRVLDLTRILSGPFAAMFLADMGAEVIKVEDPQTGDPIRRQGASVNGYSLYFATFNRNKRSFTLDLRHPEGQALLRQLIKRCDVVLNNFRPGVMDDMGLSWQALQHIKPDIISCHVTGFGLDGPYAQRPSFDFIAQAMSGFMSVNGFADGPPMRAAPPISDLVAGSYAAMGVLAALVRRARTGQGEEVATALTDGMTSMLAFLASNYFANGQLPQRTGNDHALASPYGLFEASDGQIAVAPSNDSFYVKLLAALDLQHLKDRPEFATNALRFEHRNAINGEINARTRLMPMAHWIEVINHAGVPCGRVLNVAEVFDDPQTQHQQMRVRIDHPEHGPMDVLGFPIKFTQAPCTMHRPPPALGADTDAILQELGYTQAQTQALRKANAI
ncbi:MAG: CoA transferase [Betaproteobacteria bacterium]|nr:CoA transferase [Betaproteobacteria bacterium]NBY03915.1 CoA transferase [Betaproteobacteria bacterium]